MLKYSNKPGSLVFDCKSLINAQYAFPSSFKVQNTSSSKNILLGLYSDNGSISLISRRFIYVFELSQI